MVKSQGHHLNSGIFSNVTGQGNYKKPNVKSSCTVYTLLTKAYKLHSFSFLICKHLVAACHSAKLKTSNGFKTQQCLLGLIWIGWVAVVGSEMKTVLLSALGHCHLHLFICCSTFEYMFIWIMEYLGIHDTLLISLCNTLNSCLIV